MKRRSFFTLLIGSPAVFALAACGSDGTSEPVATDPPLPPVTEAPRVTSPPATTPPDDVEVGAIFEYGNYGGFTTPNIFFGMQPQVLVTTDNRVITPAPVIALYPGPLVAPNNERSITPEGVQRLVDAADEAGLLRDITYESPQNVADAGTATLKITVDGTTYVHEAYALGVGGPPGPGSESSPEREALAAFVDRLGDLASLVGTDALGPEQPYEPDAYHVSTLVVDDLSGYEIAPTVVEWPSDTGVVLADVGRCAEVDRADVGDLFAGATELTFFTEGGVTYQLLVRPAYPDREC